MSTFVRSTLSGLAVLAAGIATPLAAPANAQEPYREPPPEIVKILDAPPLPWVSSSADGEVLLFLERENLPPIREMAQPMLKLAGMRVNPATNARFGPRSIIGVRAVDASGADIVTQTMGAGMGLGSPNWSPDGKSAAFTVTHSGPGEAGVSMGVLDVSAGTWTSLSGPVLNTLGVGPQWIPGRNALIVGYVDAERGAPPEASPVPTGPVIQESLGGDAAPVRTYQDLLEDAHGEALLEYHFRTQLALVDAVTGERTDIGPPGLYIEATPSPDGRYLLVEQLERPFSYLVPWYRFPRSVEVWDMAGTVVAEVARLPLAERIPIQGVLTGPRSHGWRATERTAELVWVEALDGGDPNVEAAHRDRLMTLAAPFDGEARELMQLEDRFSGLSWLGDRDQALVTEYDRDERWVRTWLLDIRAEGEGAGSAAVVFDRSVQDAYGDPGSPVMEDNAAGHAVVRVADGAMLLTGSGASDEGDRPFLDIVDLETRETQRLWRNAGEEYETVVAVLATEGGAIELLTRRETPTEPPNYYRRTVPADGGASMRVAVTSFEHPAPELLDVRKELVTYERDDGVSLSATLYLPPGHQEGDVHPLLVWAYPREFNDPAMASQVRGSPWRFTLFGGSSHLFMLTQGYAVMDGATMPVVGSDPETVNDTFIEQVVASAAAAIEEAVTRGVSDGERTAVAGHSYGAFMTANLLAHSDLFKAGIARSGAYNRTLTPFGFQAERRTFWEAPETYFELSPFMHADQINEPLLMIHGMDDNNSGTFPVQSERMYHAVKGHGGTTRLVMLPEESHGYRARESVLHTLAEMTDWLDRWVKNAPGT